MAISDFMCGSDEPTEIYYITLQFHLDLVLSGHFQQNVLRFNQENPLCVTGTKQMSFVND